MHGPAWPSCDGREDRRMPSAIDLRRSALLLIDFQARLRPAIDGADATLAEAARVLGAARILGAPAVFTEQNPARLGPTCDELRPAAGEAVLSKMTFDACRADGFATALEGRPDVVVAGWETHVCVLQTVLGLLDCGRRVFVLSDAVGSRRAESRRAGLDRMRQRGAEIVTAEMAIFEWLESADHPAFRDVLPLVR
jgi:nicotinamidase-related amidase